MSDNPQMIEGPDKTKSFLFLEKTNNGLIPYNLSIVDSTSSDISTTVTSQLEGFHEYLRPLNMY
jgi:hypothetical protein